MKNLQTYKAIALVEFRNGKTCLFWQDTWGDVNLRVNSPELFSFAKNKFISVAKAWNQNSPNQLLHLPILDIALIMNKTYFS